MSDGYYWYDDYSVAAWTNGDLRWQSMAAYIVVDIAQVHNEAAYASYRSQVSVGLEASGGEYLVRGGEIDVLEGSWKPGRLVVVRFESVDAARRWWTSPAYASLKRLRQDSTRTNMVLVEGLALASEEGR